MVLVGLGQAERGEHFADVLLDGAVGPLAISEAEAARFFSSREEAAAQPRHKVNVDYEIGDSVKVMSGPFASFIGTVEELDFEKSRVKVSVSIFGRSTPVDLEYGQVEKL